MPLYIKLEEDELDIKDNGPNQQLSDRSTASSPELWSDPGSPSAEESSEVEHLQFTPLIQERAATILSLIPAAKKRRRDSTQSQEKSPRIRSVSPAFPKKMWMLIESDLVKSVTWCQNGTHVIIDEEMFVREILEKEPPRVFETKSVRSFYRQLNLYGFSKQCPGYESTPSVSICTAGEQLPKIAKKLQVFSNPLFQRGRMDLLSQMKRRVGIRAVEPSGPASTRTITSSTSSIGELPTEDNLKSASASTSTSSLASSTQGSSASQTPSPALGDASQASQVGTSAPVVEPSAILPPSSSVYQLELTTTTTTTQEASPLSSLPRLGEAPQALPQRLISPWMALPNPMFTLSMMAALSLITSAQQQKVTSSSSSSSSSSSVGSVAFYPCTNCGFIQGAAGSTAVPEKPGQH